MRQADSYSNGEFETAIAAAAAAIASLEENDDVQKQRRSVRISGLPKTKSKFGDNRTTSFSGSFRRWFTDQEASEDRKPAGSMRIESGKEMRAQSTKKPSISSLFGNRSQNERWAKTNKAAAIAEGWEKEHMTKIKNKYDKMMSMILEWEKEKKAKAKTRMEQKQNQSEKRRERASQKYKDEISRIEQVASAARAQAEERRRSDEEKIREKANKIRTTGKVPHACSCF